MLTHCTVVPVRSRNACASNKVAIMDIIKLQHASAHKALLLTLPRFHAKRWDKKDRLAERAEASRPQELGRGRTRQRISQQQETKGRATRLGSRCMYTLTRSGNVQLFQRTLRGEGESEREGRRRERGRR